MRLPLPKKYWKTDCVYIRSYRWWLWRVWPLPWRWWTCVPKYCWWDASYVYMWGVRFIALSLRLIDHVLCMCLELQYMHSMRVSSQIYVLLVGRSNGSVTHHLHVHVHSPCLYVTMFFPLFKRRAVRKKFKFKWSDTYNICVGKHVFIPQYACVEQDWAVNTLYWPFSSYQLFQCVVWLL